MWAFLQGWLKIWAQWVTRFFTACVVPCRLCCKQKAGLPGCRIWSVGRQGMSSLWQVVTCELVGKNDSWLAVLVEQLSDWCARRMEASLFKAIHRTQVVHRQGKCCDLILLWSCSLLPTRASACMYFTGSMAHSAERKATAVLICRM